MDSVDIRFFKMAVGSDRIKQETPTDITARCPICGDSKYSKSKARLHLYEKNGVTLVNCFNECSVNNITMERFLKDFYPTLLPSYRDEKGSNTLANLKNFMKTDISKTMSEGLGDFNFDDFYNKETEETKEDKELELLGVGKNPPILFDLTNNFKRDDAKITKYCKERGIVYNPEWKWLVGKDIIIDGKNFRINDYIVIPLYCGGKMYGFYSRSMKEHRFQTYIPDKNTGFKVWNLYNIDITKPIYVFEGIFDALSAYQNGITNVIACLGATPPMDLLQGLDLIFCLDNDRTGLLNNVKYLKKGYKALIYPNDIKYKDLNEMLNNNVNIKDLIDNNVGYGILALIKIQRKL